MLIAYNNDIEFHSRWYHIQTEDNGIKDGHITTTVFYSGRILDSKTVSYTAAIAGVTDEEAKNKIIKDMMVNQHQQYYARLMEGTYETQVNHTAHHSSGAHAAVPPTARAVSASLPSIGSGDSNATSSFGKSGRPDILRASQQLNTDAKSLSSIKPILPLPSKGDIRPNTVNKARGSLSQSLPTSATLSQSASSAIPRTPSLKAPIPTSRAVKLSLAAPSHRAFLGLRWPSEELAIDALVASLLDSPQS